MNEIIVGQGNTKIMLNWLSTSNGICIILTGGDKAHIGAVALSLPRQSLAGNHISCDTWQIPVAGHKDIIVAKKTAELLCCALNAPVSVTAGIHINNPSKKEIMDIIKNCVVAGNKLIKLLKTNS